jgi:hypothetical protein
MADVAKYNGTNVPIMVEREPLHLCRHDALAWDEVYDGCLRCSDCSGVWRFDVKRARAALRWRRGRRRLARLADMLVWVSLGILFGAAEGWSGQSMRLVGLGMLAVGAGLGIFASWMPRGTFDG